MNPSRGVLRDRKIGTAEFRHVAKRVREHPMRKAGDRMRQKNISSDDIVIAIILRAAIAFLDAAVRIFPKASIGVLGLKRGEKTLEPHRYYESLPPISKKNTVLVLNPMLATGGSAEAAAKKLIEHGAGSKNVYFIGIVAAHEGISRLARLIPKENIMLAAVDTGLDEHGMIVPGIGDFGDRYFGYIGHAIIS